MHKILILNTLLTVLTLNQVKINPPIWADVFAQGYIQDYKALDKYAIGKIHYDYNKGFQRVELSDGQYDVLCGSVLPGIATTCLHYVRQKKRYIAYPQRRQCCMCCDEEHGCGINQKDWLSNATYQGQQSIMGQSFNKWKIIINSVAFVYYETKTQPRIPRRLVDPYSQKIQDFVVNSYTTQPIPSNIFDLPEYCKNTCPSTTICGLIQRNLKQFIGKIKTNKIKYI